MENRTIGECKQCGSPVTTLPNDSTTRTHANGCPNRQPAQTEVKAMDVKAEAVRLLRELQWSGDPDGHGCGACPACWRARGDGHRLGCDIAAVVAVAEAEAQASTASGTAR